MFANRGSAEWKSIVCFYQLSGYSQIFWSPWAVEPFGIFCENRLDILTLFRYYSGSVKRTQDTEN